MKLTMPRFDNAQVLVVGDIMLDRYWHGSTSRVSPEAPVPVVKVGQTEDRAGGAANVAVNVAALGAGAALVGTVGNDEAANAIRQRLQAARVHYDLSVSETSPTITKHRVISRHQQLIRMDFEEPFTDVGLSDIESRVVDLLPHMKAMILSDYAKGVLEDASALISAARKLGVPVFVDPKGTDFTLYRGATLLTPNLGEFEQVVGPCNSEKELVSKGQQLLGELDLEALLITRGEHGMTLLRQGEPEFHLPARAIEVFDVTGAGDTVISVLAASVASGESLPRAVALSNLAAGLVVGKLGTATVSGPELNRAIQAERGTERGVVSEEQLGFILQDARKHDESIVFTNGCFDILHAGHVGYLEEASKLGDRLIVAVNSDASVKKLKGDGRPINPAEERMLVLSKLEAVDWVICFDDDTPERLLEALNPDVLVKGGDYAINEVVGAPIVKGYGGKVEVLSLVDNRSTTAIVEKIQNAGQD
jgi:D-beta-D-heptose 7-phosphate kinase/D-beta-D-heptose 1-phosphate adenosyltransferase